MCTNFGRMTKNETSFNILLYGGRKVQNMFPEIRKVFAEIRKIFSVMHKIFL